MNHPVPCKIKGIREFPRHSVTSRIALILQGVAGSNPVSPTKEPFAKLFTKRPGRNKKKSLLTILRSDFLFKRMLREPLPVIRCVWLPGWQLWAFQGASDCPERLGFALSDGIGGLAGPG